MKNTTWEIKKIGDIVEIHRGASPRPIQNFLSDKGMPWVKIADATADISRFISSTKECIKEAGVPRSVIVTPGTLIVSNSATPGLPKIMQITACVHDGWLVFSNYKGVMRDFLYYKFIDIRKSLTNQANGSVFQNLKTDIVKNFEITLPAIDIQQKIVSFLQSIDAKLENLTEINHNLEEQAKAIFKSWFVDFEPFGYKAPCTWESGILGDFVEIKRGGSPRPIQNYLSNSGLRWLKISDATACPSPFLIDIKEHIKESGLSKTVLLNTGALVLSNSATPGIPKILDVDSCIHDGWLYFPKSKLSNEFLFLFFKHIRSNLVSLGNGSVFTNLKTDILKAYPFILPDEQTLKAFNDLIFSVFERIKNNSREINSLAQLRDALLPKLMSGEIDVSEVEV